MSIVNLSAPVLCRCLSRRILVRGKRSAATDAATTCSSHEAQQWTWTQRRFPSWQCHGGVAMLLVGAVNGLLVIGGFGITWLSTLKRHELDCKTQRLTSDLERTNRQLEALLGPLRAITHATHSGFRSFVTEHRGTLSYRDFEAHICRCPRSREAQHYRQLVSCTLQPLNLRVMELVLNNTHLIDGDFPECLYALYAHVIEMNLLLERWASRDYTVMFPRTEYPSEVNVWASREFERLRQKQVSLLTELEASRIGEIGVRQVLYQ